MFVTVGIRKFRVQFVHSARDLKTSRASDNPGGLRQLVDNLAKSLHRRVTFAEVADIVETTTAAKNKHVDKFVESVLTPVAQGFAVCHHLDNFVKRVGRARALYRALRIGQQDATINASEADAISAAAGFGTFAELKLEATVHAEPQVTSIPLAALYPKVRSVLRQSFNESER
jgi:hypothetical protein